MTNVPPTWQRRLGAAEAALGLLAELGVNQTAQVDVFKACDDLGLWLAFLPLENALGAYVPEGVGGVLVTTERHVTVQRYTAAHEIGHWHLDHGRGVAIDGEAQVFGRTPPERERLAQIFAANFLMPPPLVYSVLQRTTGTPMDVTPTVAYAVAREAGVSYEAAVRQLNNLDIIEGHQAADLLRPRPLTIKAAVAGGRRPINGYADVWPVDERWNAQRLTLHLEDEIAISLPENRTSGYRWFAADAEPRMDERPPPPAFATVPPAGAHIDFARATSSSRAPTAALQRIPKRAAVTTDVAPRQIADGVELVGDTYIPARAPHVQRPTERRRIRLAAAGHASQDELPSGGMVGATGRRLLGARFTTPGEHRVRFVYRPAYRDESPVEQYEIVAVVDHRRRGFSIDQLVEGDEDWIEDVRDRAATGRSRSDDLDGA